MKSFDGDSMPLSRYKIFGSFGMNIHVLKVLYSRVLYSRFPPCLNGLLRTVSNIRLSAMDLKTRITLAGTNSER